MAPTSDRNAPRPGAPASAFHVVEGPIDADGVRARVEHPHAGAVIVFHGTVRTRTADREVTHLEYEAYGPMAIKQMAALGADLVDAHGLVAVAATHRVGRLEPGEAAVVVAISAPHRAAALAAVDEFLVRLKRDVPIWKKEHFEGGAVWIGTPDDPQGVRSGPPGPETTA